MLINTRTRTFAHVHRNTQVHTRHAYARADYFNSSSYSYCVCCIHSTVQHHCFLPTLFCSTIKIIHFIPLLLSVLLSLLFPFSLPFTPFTLSFSLYLCLSFSHCLSYSFSFNQTSFSVNFSYLLEFKLR